MRRDGRRGVIGLRLHAGTAQALRLRGSGFLQAAQRQDAAADNARPRRYGPWQRLSNGSYWARSTDALLGVLLASEEAAVWLLWQQPAAAAPGNGAGCADARRRSCAGLAYHGRHERLLPDC
ncbi:hypothetical protein XPR_1675 [Xanthomonas arboricola pv. pruni MAFF 301420]|uniref:Uncharacterized protein n=2 Tax=Xanthomonas arboricola pv. pruni TaxID=69929 RepID=W4SEN6_9XANT|nr:hypothetical protein XPU_1928 [Xanthomonas arboricola pv. pruni str. MAFF 311562]GAE55040.1 hypothetical protein XPR_1675 [Xanthomonas arboricola pv. pruni MAFF 301420]GAE62521.1 hypothetical protein XPN_4427 [Xanthomonas arboricola pv. pruni MAFF 301427]